MKRHPSDRALLVEVGWEVCSQLGGIYTVLRTKAQTMVADWGERYCLIGPYNAGSAGLEFEETARTGPFGQACDRLERETRVRAHFGKWLVPGEPQVVLLELDRPQSELDHVKYLAWKDHQIDLRANDREVDQCVLFGYLVAEYLERLVAEAPELPVLTHCHEWMAGMPIPVVRRRALPVTTVFTTHATILGRYLAADDENFYHNLASYDPHAEAGRRNIYSKYAIERAATHGATCFTTISEITGAEAEHLLGRRADVLLPNGLNSKRFAAVHEFQNLHLIYKKRIQEFLMGHFFPSYTFDLSKTLHLFTAGRYEHRNKGLDLFIEGLARLNWRLKQEKRDVTVVAFIVTKAPVRGFNVHVLKNQMLFREMHDFCEDVSKGVASKLLMAAAAGRDPRDPKATNLFEDGELQTLKRLTHAWRQTHPLPNVVTHNLENEDRDPILNQLRQSGLVNHPEDPVKVVYHPDFMSAASPLLGLDYEQFVRGCHLGVFPSYYEPWGYTPEECAALGIPSVTSDLAGFGTFVRDRIPGHGEKGLMLIERRYKSFHESADQLTSAMHRVVTASMRDRIEMRNRVEAESARFDWSQLIPAYRRAHRIALARARHGRSAQRRARAGATPFVTSMDDADALEGELRRQSLRPGLRATQNLAQATPQGKKRRRSER